MINIKGFIDSSFIDWKGRVCAVLFLGGCNFRCPFCHNHPLVTNPGSIKDYNFSDILTRLTPLKKWLGGICISGGEPTLSPKLPKLLESLKAEGWGVKLDTNGSNPLVLKELIDKRFVDMISMDVKSPLDQRKYNNCAGVDVDMDKIKQSITLIQESGIDHEFRMTIVPKYHTREDIIDWASLFKQNAILTLQNFNPRTTLDPELEREKGFTQEQFEELQQIVKEAGLQSEEA